MSDVREVFITKEVADKLNITPTYLIRVALEMNFSENEMRSAGKRTYLFNTQAVNKLSARFCNKK